MTVQRLRASLADRYRLERELGAGHACHGTTRLRTTLHDGGLRDCFR